MKKNVAGQFIGCQLISKTDGSAVTSGTTTIYITGDAGTQAVGSVGSGACAHEGNGYWSYAPAQAETNYGLIAFTFVNTSACNVTVQVYPSFPQSVDNDTNISAIKTKTDYLPSVTAGTAGGVFIAGTNAATSITTALTANISGNVSGSIGSVAGSVASVTGAVGSVTSGVTVATNSDKTGYSLSQAFPANFASMAISATTGLVDVTQAAADKAWGTSSRLLTAGTNIALAKGTGITGFNDMDAAGIAAATWNAATATYGTAGSYGLLIESNLDAPVSGATAPTAAAVADAVWDESISGHLGAGTTGNALNAAGSAGDPWATPIPGAYGSGTAGKILGDNVNATISSRMAAFNQPTGFLAATFPTTVASPTNITAATGITLSAVTHTGAVIPTVTTLTGHTAQTGDSFVRIGSAGAGLTALGDTRIANLDAAVSSRSTYSGGAVASVSGSVGSVTGMTASDIAAIKAKTDLLPAAPASTTNITAASGITLAATTHTGAVIPTVSAVTGLTASDVSAIKQKTDSLAFTVANQIDVNIQSINDIAITGNGSTTPFNV